MSSGKFAFPYNRPTTVKASSDDVKAAWQSWKSAHITSNNTGKPDRFRVIGEPKDGSTFSEGMGYGLLFASLMDDQPLFDGMWRFTADHLNANGLMHWKIGAPQEYRGTGAATDGDEDIAMGLVQACVKTRTGTWPASTLDYCALGTKMINNIYAFEVDRAGAQPKNAPVNNKGGELLPGDSWDTTNKPTMNMSYFAPAYFRVFGAFTGRVTEWNTVVTRNYELLNKTQAIAGNCSKLIPNWNDYEGNVRQVDWQPQNSGWWSWDAARVGVRIALDRAWTGSPDAIETSNEIGSFFASVGVENVKAEYGLDGTAKQTYTSPFFISNAAAPIWAATKLTPVKCGAAGGSVLSTPQKAYDTNLNDDGPTRVVLLERLAPDGHDADERQLPEPLRRVGRCCRCILRATTARFLGSGQSERPCYDQGDRQTKGGGQAEGQDHEEGLRPRSRSFDLDRATTTRK